MTYGIERLGINTPGKIIAVHLNYPSRIAQRGRTPEFPSYFFKPASSLAPTGGSIERPAGAELLAFEGEIALVIGEPARWVSPEAGWKHVAQVTAANDFGLYDLRAADKGSNVRNKGGDGFTPLGPVAIPTTDPDGTEVGEGDWRVRTWVNGELVQDDTSNTLKFSFGHLVADLSQHFTLETGDVILTGTPAGSSVVVPGDTVEVEVDAPNAPGAPTTGRLVTTVTQGTTAFGNFGNTPAIDDKQRVEAWGSEAEHATAVAAGKASPLDIDGPVSEAHATGGSALTPEIRELLDGVAVATVSAQLRKRGYVDTFIDGVHPNHEGDRILGTAKSLRFIPFRPDLFKEFGGGYNAQKRAFDTVQSGEVLVVDSRGECGTGTVGDVLALRAQVRGAAGIVTDGGVRDYRAVQEFDIPVFSQGGTPERTGSTPCPMGGRRDHRLRRCRSPAGRHHHG